MLFKVAKDRLKEIARDRYHSISYELIEHHDGSKENVCSGYIDGHGWRKGCTFAEVILRFEQDVNGKAPDSEEMPVEDAI